jgi:hypothetical protein
MRSICIVSDSAAVPVVSLPVLLDVVLLPFVLVPVPLFVLLCVPPGGITPMNLVWISGSGSYLDTLAAMLAMSSASRGGLHRVSFTAARAALISSSPKPARLMWPAIDVRVVLRWPSGITSLASVTSVVLSVPVVLLSIVLLVVAVFSIVLLAVVVMFSVTLLLAASVFISPLDAVFFRVRSFLPFPGTPLANSAISQSGIGAM